MSALDVFYSRPGNKFGLRGPFYGSVGHRGADYKVKAGTKILAWEGGEVVAHTRSYYLGLTITIKLADGNFASYAHVASTSVGARVGRTVKRGQYIGKVAGAKDKPGASWAGDHSHCTLGDRIDSVFRGYVTDPTPRIIANLAAARGRKYTVVSGDTLSSIGKRYGKSWVTIYNANKRVIGINPNRIRVGAILNIP